MFCPECKGILYPGEGGKVCRKCGYTEAKPVKEDLITRDVEENERLVIEDRGDTLPTTFQLCPKCDHKKAYYVLRQTRAADEPTTRIYQCVKCSHKWREY